MRKTEAEKFYGKLSNGTLLRSWRKFMRPIPRGPRCRLCYVPFKGFGRIFGLAGFGPSRMNPSFCNVCERAPLGGIEMEIGVLFADVRNYTAWSEACDPRTVAGLLNRFYAAATEVLIRHDALIDKLVGDQVMALFMPTLSGSDYRRTMIDAAVELLESVGAREGSEWLPLGVGLDAGVAFVGNIGTASVRDFTALGDVVNTAARLQSAARAGEIVLSKRVYEAAGALPRGWRAVDLTLKGKAEPEPALVIDVAAGESKP